MELSPIEKQMQIPNKANKVTSSDGLDLGKNDFLKLFMENLKHQDPMSPMDNAQMMQQMTQLGLMEGIQNMSMTINDMKESLMGSQLQQGAALLGKTVVAEGEDNQSIVGTPNAYRLNDGIVEYLINNKVVQIGQIKEVGI